LCNGVKREYVRTCPAQASRLFCSVPLQKFGMASSFTQLSLWHQFCCQ